MRENKISVAIDRSVSEVYEFTTNPSNTHLWIDGIVHEETNEYPIRVGTIYRNINAQGEWTEYRVVQLVQDGLFELNNGRYSVRYLYEDLPVKGTELTYFEWVSEGELDEPFTVEVLEKLRTCMESAA